MCNVFNTLRNKVCIHPSLHFAYTLHCFPFYTLKMTKKINPLLDYLSSTCALQCTMLLLSTKSCLKSSKVRPILNGQLLSCDFQNICLNVFGSKQPREILVFLLSNSNFAILSIICSVQQLQEDNMPLQQLPEEYLGFC